MKILFLGYVISSRQAEELSGSSMAGNRMQLEMLEALIRREDVTVDALAVLPVATFPTERKLFYKTRRQVPLLHGLTVTYPGFLTFPFVKQVGQIIGMSVWSVKFLRNTKYDFILTFNMYPQIGLPSALARKIYRVPVACLLADPPIRTTAPRGIVHSLLLDALERCSEWSLRNVDRVVALSEAAAKKFAPQAKAVVIDGAIPSSWTDERPEKQRCESRRRDVVFTGSLTTYNGVLELVEAMSLVTDSSVSLHVYGSGPLESLIKDAAKRMHNVFFHGKLSSNQIQGVQRNAFLLVNPRQISHAVSDVTFPSKILEYMSSGTPVLTTRLRSFSTEYSDLLFFADVGSPADLAEWVDRIARIPDSILREKGEACRSFVQQHRTWDAAAEKIFALLKSL